MADQISDAVLDAILRKNPCAKVACEVLLTEDQVIVAGEINPEIEIPLEDIVRETIREIGYTDPSFGFDYKTCRITNLLRRQSEDIAGGVDFCNGEIGAGDQGMMFGYATDETPELMPLPIVLAHKLVQGQAELRKSGRLPWLRPDAKSQVTLRYIGERPVEVAHVVLSTQHAPDVGIDEIRAAVVEEIINKVIPEELRAKNIRYSINPTGRFVTGGPKGDTGLTGRKIIVDTYGGSCPHGGGSFSGKDPTKVDRSGAYMARHMAKNVVASGLARRCTVQLSYAIGEVHPTSVMVDLHGTGQVDEKKLEGALPSLFDLTPKGMIESLDLRRPIYRKTAAYGHFGREFPEFTWERTDKAAPLKAYFGI
jgi:S-adenosylmethionine synthetase